MKNDKLEAIQAMLADTDLSAKSFNPAKLFNGFDPDDKVHDLREWVIEKGLDAKAFDKAHRAWRITETLGGYPATVQEYVDLFVAKYGITAKFNGLLEAPKTGAVANHPNVEKLGRDLRLLSGKLTLPYKRDDIADASSSWLWDVKAARLEQAFAHINVAESIDADADWLRLANAIADTNEVSAGYVVSVFKSAIWQVKRKLVDEPDFPVGDHLMPMLTGPQGSGKTHFTLKFFSPLSDLVSPTDFGEITDGKNFGLWEFPVLFLDEMEKAERSDVEAIKNAITRSIKSGRVLYTGDTGTVRNRATLWGCTNGTLGDKIADPTGLRRFAPIPVKHAPSQSNIEAGLSVVDWDTISGINYQTLWQSVDYRAAHPLQDNESVKVEWSRLCESERTQDSVEAWLRQIVPDKTDFASDKKITTTLLYDSERLGYSDWAKASGCIPFNKERFAKRLTSLCKEPWCPLVKGKGSKASFHTWKPEVQDIAKNAAEKVVQLAQLRSSR